jgi:hypothetical protein
MPRGGQRNGERPGLIDLFDNVQGMTLDWMETGRLELHPPEQVKGIAGLGRNPNPNLRGGIPDLTQIAINVPDVSYHHTASPVFLNHAPCHKRVITFFMTSYTEANIVYAPKAIR